MTDPDFFQDRSCENCTDDTTKHGVNILGTTTEYVCINCGHETRD